MFDKCALIKPKSTVNYLCRNVIYKAGKRLTQQILSCLSALYSLTVIHLNSKFVC